MRWVAATVAEQNDFVTEVRRLGQAVDVEHAGRGVIVRVALGDRDTAVGDDRALPVDVAGRELRDLLPLVGT